MHAMSVVSFAPSGLCCLDQTGTHSLRCGLHSFAALRLESVWCMRCDAEDFTFFLLYFLSTTEFFQHLRFDVAAGDDRHV